MLNSSANPIITLITFGLTTLLVGGFFGGEMARRRHVKEDIKAIQLEHSKTLARIDSVVQRSMENEAAALAQIDSVYMIIGELNQLENKSRSNIRTVTDHLNDQRKKNAELREEFSKNAASGGFTLKNKKTGN